MKIIEAIGLAAVLCSLTGLAAGQAGGDPLQLRVELQPTDTMIELEAQFTSCPGKKTFKVQDGAMNVLSAEGVAPIRFVVKRGADGDVLMHMVDTRSFDTPNGPVPGLVVRSPVSLLHSQAPADLIKVGLASLSYRTSYPLAAMTVGSSGVGSTRAGSVSPQVAANNCCSFRGCGGAYWTFCTTGAAGCGGDDCGGCCVPGRVGPSPQ